MTNLGNTCFLNAISQCLLVTESLASLAPPPIVNALTKLKSTDNQTIRPKELVRVISQLNPSMASGQQQDAAEALELLLASDVVQGPQSEPSRGGGITDVISCLTCGSRSAIVKSFNPPILRVPVTAPTLDLCLTDLLTPQSINDRRCDLCHTVASKLSTEILTTPQAMVVQLLRFQQGTEVRKNSSSVKLTPTIHLDGATWHITGIVNHTGTLHQGHYTAYVCHHHRWFRCDDARVFEASAKAAFDLSEKSAYLIFLSKV